MKRILVTLVLALAFTAAAQTIEYASLSFSFDSAGRGTDVRVELPERTIEGHNFVIAARQITGNEDIVSMNLAGMLTLMARVGWRPVLFDMQGNFHHFILERSPQ